MLVSVAIWNVASEACRLNFLCSQLHVVLVPSFHFYVLWKLEEKIFWKYIYVVAMPYCRLISVYCFENVMLYFCQPRCIIRNRVEVLFKKHVYVAVSRDGYFPIFIPHTSLYVFIASIWTLNELSSDTCTKCHLV